ncbi:hypothetical protein JCM1840_005020 [Sporobolomyces johnsonii]
MSVSTVSTRTSSHPLSSSKPFQAPFSALPAPLSTAEEGQAQPVYAGEGTTEKPFILKFEEGDPENPQNWSPAKKWAITANVAVSTLCVAFGSSIYAGGLSDLLVYFDTSQEVITLGLSLYVLGFALGPLLWAPFSEQWGRILVFRYTYFPFAAFHIGSACARNLETMLICRFLAGFFGASPLTNSGGTIGDLFSASDRALAMSLFALAPFMGPVLGPIVGGYLGANASWRWLFWLLTIFSFVMYALGLLNPETYAPVLLRRRAAKLQNEAGQVYRSMYDLHPRFSAPFAEKMKTALHRPFVLLFKEMIVLLLSLYAAVIYGILYLMFGAFPIVFERERGWGAGAAGLPFIGVGVGMVLACIVNLWDNKRYVRNLVANGGSLPPEARLPMCCVAGCALPIGLFWFAWTTMPSVHWIVPTIAAAPFGFGMVLVFLSMTSYLVDAYLMYAASALASNAVLRSIFGAIFPLFTSYLFSGLGTQWALSFIAFLSLALAPIPFIFYYYGARIRANSTFAPGHKPAAAAAAAAAPASQPQLERQPTLQQQLEANEITDLDLAQAVSHKQEIVKEWREGTYHQQEKEFAEPTSA